MVSLLFLICYNSMEGTWTPGEGGRSGRSGGSGGSGKPLIYLPESIFSITDHFNHVIIAEELSPDKGMLRV